MSSGSSRNLTVVDVARAAGVSVSTAAGALRGASSVNSLTRERVCAIAEKLGYRRNTAASVLASRRAANEARTISIAYLTHFPPGVPVGKFAFSTPRELARLCAERGWIFAHHNLRDLATAPALARQLEARGVEVAILGAAPGDRLHTAFPWHRFVCLSDLRDRVNDGFDVVRPNHFGSVENILHGLNRAGYRRIGFFHLHHPRPLQDDLSRLAGCLAYNEVVSGPARASVFKAEYSPLLHTERASVARIRAWLRETDPDVVVGTSQHCLTAIEAAEEARVRRKRKRAFLSLIVNRESEGHVAGLRDARVTVAPILLARALDKLRLGQLGLGTDPMETVFWTEFVPGLTLPPVDTRAGTETRLTLSARKIPEELVTGSSTAP